MSPPTPTMPPTRRDQRFSLLAGSSTVELEDPSGSGQHLVLSLIDLSIAGLTLELRDHASDLEPGGTFAGAVLRVGDCELRGEVSVRNVRSTGDRQQIGALFYPATAADQERLMVLMAGIEAAQVPIARESGPQD